MWTKKIKTLLIFTLFSFIENGFPQSEDVTNIKIAKLLNGKSYYHLNDKVTCKSNDPDRTIIKSWVNKISFNDNQILIWGTICSDSPEIVKFKSAGRDLLVSSDLQLIIYKKEVLYFRNPEPKLCDEGKWCPQDRLNK